MLLQELAVAGGVSPATIKYYRREGLLPPGQRITATRQDYGRSHLDRLALIGVLRDLAGAPITDIKVLVDVLDDPAQPLLRALEIGQAIASGLPASRHAAPVPEDEHPLVRPLLEDLGWPDVASGPRAALDAVLASMEAAHVPVDLDVLRRHGRLLAELARGDLDQMQRPLDDHPEATPSDDVVVMRVVAGTVCYDKIARALRALGHASLSILDRTP